MSINTRARRTALGVGDGADGGHVARRRASDGGGRPGPGPWRLDHRRCRLPGPIIPPVVVSIIHGVTPQAVAAFIGPPTIPTPALGLRTPPAGTGLGIAAALGGISTTRLVAPSIRASIAVILLVIFVPWAVRPF